MIRHYVDDVLYFGVILSILIRWAVSRFPYSGYEKPPMYGDYEAQRHWMEITVNLPIDEWYKNTTRNDLQYWGLDYPPLMAYQSLMFGYLAKLITPDWIALNTSRGYESYHHKIFMRSTVVAVDLLIYYPAVILYWTVVSHPFKLRDKAIACSLTLLYPGLILIDHGHFQYNCVSLGFTLWAVILMTSGFDISGACFFTLALHYKQMSLYYALPFFCYLMGTSIQLSWKNGASKFLKLASVVIITSIICWAPFISSFESFFQVVRRLFPFDRGLYEDKVANIWYALSVIVKLKSLLPTSTLAVLSAITTFVGILPSCYHLLFNPNIQVFKLALVNSSLVFFLFSFQVHEKSILLAALPVLLLLEDYPLACTWFLCISTFSLVPLLAKDGLVIPFIALTCLFLTGVFRAYDDMGMSFRKSQQALLKATMFSFSLLGCLVLVIAMYTVKQPDRYPHLHILLNCIYSCAHFIGFTLYFYRLQFITAPSTHPKKKLKLK